MKYEVVCTKRYLDVGLLLERNEKLKPKRVLARATTYSNNGEYGGVETVDWIGTGVFLSIEEWNEISYNKPTDQILNELGINEETKRDYDMEEMIKASRKAEVTRNQLLDTLFEEGVLAVYNLGMKHMYEYLEDK